MSEKPPPQTGRAAGGAKPKENRMEQNKRLAGTGFLTFFLSGICAISSGVIVSLLQERYGLSFGLTGSLLSVMSIGNMASSFASGVLPGKIGFKRTAAILCAGYCLGYLLMTASGLAAVLLTAFLLVGVAKGCTVNLCTVLVGSNTPDRSKGLSLMHACYAGGAMLGPFFIALLLRVDGALPMAGLAAVGCLLWLVLMTAGLPGRKRDQKTGEKADFTFLKTSFFWLVTALIFFQNAAETAVTGWLVTYYRSTGILSGALSAYTITIMWGATLIGRLLIAFVLKIRDTFKALAFMGIGCTLSYLALMLANQPLLAVSVLFLFAFSMAGINPLGTAGIGKMMNETSMGVLLPVASLGQIVMPWIIGVCADKIGLRAAMGLNLVPCLAMFVLSVIIRSRAGSEAAA